MAKVSIVLSSFNHAEFLGESIESILSQDFTDFELVIVDDASVDDSWRIIQSYKDERIRAIRNQRNTNWGFFTKEFIDDLKGEYVAIAHDDDVWYPHKLGKQVSFLDQNPLYWLCFTQVRVINEKGLSIDDPNHVFRKAFSQQNRSRYEWLGYMAFHNCPFCHPSVLMRKELYNDPDMFPVALSAIPDYYKWIVAALKHEIYIYPEELTGFRVREQEGNTSGDSFDKRNRQAYELWQALHLYSHITNPDELIRVFPQTSKYIVKGEIISSFALARVMMEQGNTPMHRQLALDILYSLLQDNAEKVQQLYGYTPRDYMLETGAQDIYGRIGPERFQDSRLYIDFGDGFTDDVVIFERNYICETGAFFLVFHLSEMTAGRPIKGIRFDPDKQLFRKYRITSLTLDGAPSTLIPTSSEKVGEWDVFYTVHASYIVKDVPMHVSCVAIEGVTAPISLYNVDDHFRSKIADLGKIIVSLHGEVSTLNTLNSGREETIDSLRGEVNTLNTLICGREETIESLRGEVTTLNTFISGREETIESLRGEVKALNVTSLRLEETIGSLRGEVSTLIALSSEREAFLHELAERHSAAYQEVSGRYVALTDFIRSHRLKAIIKLLIGKLLF